MAKYVKLGPKAGGFSDPFSRFDINKGVIKKLNQKEQTSGRIRAAIRGGHLVTCTEKEYKEYLQSLEPEVKPKTKKEPTLEEKFMEMTKDVLVVYYKDNYQVSEEEIKVFEKFKHEEMVAELLDLEKED